MRFHAVYRTELLLKKLSVSFLLPCIIFSACNKELEVNPAGEDNERNDTISGNSPKGCFIPVISDSLIIVEVTKDNKLFTLLLEDSTIISIPSECITEYQVDHDNWCLTITYYDSAEYTFPFLGDNLSLNDSNIVLDPYGNAPLSALLEFDTPLPRNIKISVEGKSDESAEISGQFELFTKHHKIPVYGLYFDHENMVEVGVLDCFGNARLTRNVMIRTGPHLRPRAGNMNIIHNNFEEHQKNRMFLIENAIYDRGGDIRWHTTTEGTRFYNLANNQVAIQVFSDRGNISPEPDILIINYLGEILHKYYVPHKVHHEISEKNPGGNLLVASNAEMYNSILDDTEDLILEIEKRSGEVVKSWDLRDIFDPTRERLWKEGINDWCHLNSIQYDSSDNTLLISSKLQYFVSKIDYDTGDIIWILGNHENWKEKWQPYLLTPQNFDESIDPDADWPYAQHMPRMTREGSIIVYDNGGERPGGEYTRAVEYRIDVENMTVNKVWDYHLDIYAKALGSVYVYNDGSVQIGHGYNGRFLEVTHDNEVLFEATMLGYYRSYPVQFY
jgi:arylsulfate sulfotransferase